MTRILAEQSLCRDWLAEHRGERGTDGAELGASDWVKEELLSDLSIKTPTLFDQEAHS